MELAIDLHSRSTVFHSRLPLFPEGRATVRRSGTKHKVINDDQGLRPYGRRGSFGDPSRSNDEQVASWSVAL